jgi:hypothetical protein
MPSHDGENSQLQYEIIELDELAFPRFRMEWREDNVCPFCSFNAVSEWRAFGKKSFVSVSWNSQRRR